MESWRLAWRDGFLPLISTEELHELLEIFEKDDPRLTQGSTTTPPPLMCVEDWPCEAGCFNAQIGVMRSGGWCPEDIIHDHTKRQEWKKYATVGKVETVFAELCFKADQRLGEPAACRYFLNWFDETPRDEMRREMIAELKRAIDERTPVDVALHAADPGSVA